MSASRSRPRRVAKPERGITRELFGSSDRVYRKVQSALIDYDAAASAYERRWGIERLPDLVPEGLRLRFWDQLDRLNEAIASNDPDEVERQAGATLRGWAALERAALEAGHKPVTGEGFEAALDDGRVIAVCATPQDAAKRAQDRPGVIAYSIDEIARMIAAWDERAVIERAKLAFAGAEIAAIRNKRKEVELDDEIPF